MNVHPSEGFNRKQVEDYYHPLFCLNRSFVPEIRIDGLWAFASYDASHRRNIFSNTPHDLKKFVVARSILKPWQFKNTEIWKHTSSAENILAIGVASQSSDPNQLSALEELIQESRISEDLLKCPESHPLSSATRKNFQDALPKKSIFHPCAGKHLMHLWSCKIHHWDLSSYRDPNHPLQQKLKILLAKELHVEKDSIQMATDSCGLPSAILTLEQHLKLWLSLSESQSHEDLLIKSFFLKYPDMIGGSKRIDSRWMHASKNSLAIKEGADGILMLQDLISPKKQSLFIKIACGFYPQLISTGILGILKKHEAILCEGFLDLMHYLEQHNELGKPAPNGGGHHVEYFI